MHPLSEPSLDCDIKTSQCFLVKQVFHAFNSIQKATANSEYCKFDNMHHSLAIQVP